MADLAQYHDGERVRLVIALDDGQGRRYAQGHLGRVMPMFRTLSHARSEDVYEVNLDDFGRGGGGGLVNIPSECFERASSKRLPDELRQGDVVRVVPDGGIGVVVVTRVRDDQVIQLVAFQGGSGSMTPVRPYPRALLARYEDRTARVTHSPERGLHIDFGRMWTEEPATPS